jgi:hypothetical protein
VARKCQRGKTRFLHDNTEFLLQFPDQRLFRPLASLDLAAGKLPKPRHGFAGRPLGEEHAAVGIDKGAGGDKNEFEAHWPCFRR